MRDINLYDILSQNGYERGEISNRDKIHSVFENCIKPRLNRIAKDEKLIVFSLAGIKSMTVSVVIKLFLMDLYQYCFQRENLIVMVSDMDEPYKPEIMMEFHGAIKIAKELKSEGELVNVCLLVRDKEQVSVVGFKDGEAQSELFYRLYHEKARLTSSDLVEKDNISIASASNRLARLYEKRIIYRDEISLNQYEYYAF